MYRQAPERASGQTRNRSRPAPRFRRLARQPVIPESQKIHTVHQLSDFVFPLDALGENTTADEFCGEIPVKSVQ